MANEKDLSNISYTSKDFQSVYPELLDLVKKLTNKWDPSLSNESDPGVILLKLNALIADKNNYNIDKNVLECFPTTVTQEGNARRLYDSLGYKMHWYRSATTEVGLQLKNSDNIDGESLKIDQFTALTDTNSQIVYTTLKDLYLRTSTADMSMLHNVECIEGTLQDFTVTDSGTELTLDNLDSDLRLYFNEKNVAENGIFIRGNNDNGWMNWTKVDNLASYPLNSKVYEFGVLPNSNVCYIQFPEDIATVLSNDNSFYIKYILSSGVKGNIKRNTINSFLQDYTIKSTDSSGQEIDVVMNDQIRILQASGTINGEDPETIDSAYRNYKRTVGTFNTLITKRDYQNFIYNSEIENDYIVSNCVVSDRNNDLNSVFKVMSWSPNYDTENTLIEVDEAGQPKLNAYQIVLYCLSAGDGTYRSTFDPIVGSTARDIINSLVDEVKAVQHDFLIPSDLSDKIYYLYKNLYPLRGQIVTYEKVTKEEARQIEQNVMGALEETYNARKVEFGEEPDYQDLIQTIQDADSRIKTVALDIPKYQIYHVTGLGDSNQAVPDPEEQIEILAKMILAGKTQLFKFDEDFYYDFGYSDVTPINDLSQYKSENAVLGSLTSETKIHLPESKDNVYEVKENEVIQIYGPSYITKQEYSTFVKYRFYGDTKFNTDKNSDGSYKALETGKDYLLQGNQVLRLSYTDSETKLPKDVKYTAGAIVNFSDGIKLVPYFDKTVSEDTVDRDWNILTTGQSIKIKGLNTDVIRAGTKLYWILNNASNKLKIDSGESYILQEGEYLLYTSSNTNELLIYGSGTKLSVQDRKSVDQDLENLDMDKLQESDLDKVSWATLGVDILATEMDITTLGKGAKIQWKDGVDNNFVISNKPVELTKEVIITDNTNETRSIYQYPEYDEVNGKGSYKGYMILSKLNVNTTQALPQQIKKETKGTNGYSEQSLSLNYYKLEDGKLGTKISDSYSVKDNYYVSFSSPVIVSGGENVDLSLLSDDSLNSYSLKAYVFNKVDFYEGQGDSQNYKRDDGVIKVSGEDGKAKTEVTFNFTFSDVGVDNGGWLIQIYVTKSSADEAGNFSVKFFTNDGVQISSYGDESLKDFKESGSYILYVKGGSGKEGFKVQINNGGKSDIVTIGSINKFLGYNTEEIDVIPDDSNNFTNADEFRVEDAKYDDTKTVLDKIKELIKNSSEPSVQFDYTYKVPDSDKVLQPTASSSFWNKNHIRNEYTIPQIDLDKTSVKVNSYSIKS